MLTKGHTKVNASTVIREINIESCPLHSSSFIYLINKALSPNIDI